MKKNTIKSIITLIGLFIILTGCSSTKPKYDGPHIFVKQDKKDIKPKKKKTFEERNAFLSKGVKYLQSKPHIAEKASEKAWEFLRLAGQVKLKDGIKAYQKQVRRAFICAYYSYKYQKNQDDKKLAKNLWYLYNTTVRYTNAQSADERDVFIKNLNQGIERCNVVITNAKEVKWQKFFKAGEKLKKHFLRLSVRHELVERDAKSVKQQHDEISEQYELLVDIKRISSSKDIKAFYTNIRMQKESALSSLNSARKLKKDAGQYLKGLVKTIESGHMEFVRLEKASRIDAYYALKAANWVESAERRHKGKDEIFVINHLLKRLSTLSFDKYGIKVVYLLDKLLPYISKKCQDLQYFDLQVHIDLLNRNTHKIATKRYSDKKAQSSLLEQCATSLANLKSRMEDGSAEQMVVKNLIAYLSKKIARLMA